jgi:hypothetical protein
LYLSICFDLDLLAHIAVRNGLCDGRNAPDLQPVSK